MRGHHGHGCRHPGICLCGIATQRSVASPP